MADEIEKVNVEDLDGITVSELTSLHRFILFTSDGDTTGGGFTEMVAQANSLNGCKCILSAKLDIATADVLTLNSVPIEIVAAPGVGYAIEVISVSMKMVYVSAAYATNTTLQLITSGAGIAQMQGNLLGATVSKVGRLATINTPTAGTTQIIENAALMVSVATGDPIAGDSDITVYVLYRIIEL